MMYCQHCGASLPDGVRFCTACGTQMPGTGPAPVAPAFSQPTPDGKVLLPAGVSAYYLKEFSYIAATGKGHFNLFAFFLVGYNALYRGCVKRFAVLYLPLILLGFGFGSASFYSLARDPFASPNMVLTLLCWLVNFAWLGVAIYDGFTFNKYLYHRQRGYATVPTHTGWVYALAGIAFAVIFTLYAVVLPPILQNMQSAFDQGYYDDSYENEYGDPSDWQDDTYDLAQACDGRVYEWIAYPAYDYDQTLTDGYADSSFGEDVDSALEAVKNGHLFYSDVLTVDAWLTGACDTVEWSTEDTGDYIQVTAHCLVDGTMVDLAFLRAGTMFWIDTASCQLATDSLHSYALSAQELSSLLACMYLENEVPPSSSLAFSMRGTWEGNGMTIDIDGFSIYVTGAPEGEIAQDYVLGDFADGTLWLWFSDAEEEEDDLFLRLNGDANTLTILENSDILAGEYTRVA